LNPARLPRLPVCAGPRRRQGRSSSRALHLDPGSGPALSGSQERPSLCQPAPASAGVPLQIRNVTVTARRRGPSHVRSRIRAREVAVASNYICWVTGRVSNRGIFFRLLGFLRPYKGPLWISVVLAVGSQLCQIALVAVTGRVVDKALRPHDTGELELLVGLILGIGLVKALLMVGRRLISGRVALGVEFDMLISL